MTNNHVAIGWWQPNIPSEYAFHMKCAGTKYVVQDMDGLHPRDHTQCIPVFKNNGSEVNLSADEANQPGPNDPILFYPKEFYPLCNFSAFTVRMDDGIIYPTSEHAYQAQRYIRNEYWDIAIAIRKAPSAHEAFQIAQANKHLALPSWQDEKFDVMKEILFLKANQHPYVMQKLMESGDRTLIEDSWRDDIWGWGPNKDGQNRLGLLWMEVRDELRNQSVH